MSQSLRPGVYSSYDISVSGVTPDSLRYAGVAALSSGGEPLSLYTITSAQQAAQFGADSPLYIAVQSLLSGGVSKVYAVPLSVRTPEQYEQALLLFREIDDIAAVVCDCPDAPCALKLKEHVLETSEVRRERVGFLGADGFAQALELAGTLNCERVMLVTPASNGEEDGVALSVLSAAAIAGVIVTRDDPSYNFSGAQVPGIGSLAARFTEEQVNALISAGVTVLEESYGVIECIRALSTRTSTQGVPDKSYSSINTALIIDHVMRALRNALKLRLKGAKNNSFTLSGIASQAVVVLSELRDAGVINSYAAPRAYTHAQDPSVCVVEISFEVSHVINQIHIMAHIQI